MLRAERPIVQPVCGALRGRHVMHQDVGSGEDRVERFAVRGVGQIQRDAVLAGVQIKKQSALFGVFDVAGKRSAPAREIALGRFDLDHLRTEQRQHLGGKGSRDPLPALDCCNAGQRQASPGVSLGGSRVA